jgi:hypothetical protein
MMWITVSLRSFGGSRQQRVCGVLALPCLSERHEAVA